MSVRPVRAGTQARRSADDGVDAKGPRLSPGPLSAVLLPTALGQSVMLTVDVSHLFGGSVKVASS
jgi:hypothetical protein